MLARSPLAARLLVILAIVAVLLPALASNADALGQRYVYRSCGTNYIQSSNPPPYPTGYAQTLKVSGTCAGRLSVRAYFQIGGASPRLYGTNQQVQVYANTLLSGAAHWGCDACSASYT